MNYKELKKEIKDFINFFQKKVEKNRLIIGQYE